MVMLWMFKRTTSRVLSGIVALVLLSCGNGARVPDTRGAAEAVDPAEDPAAKPTSPGLRAKRAPPLKKHHRDESSLERIFDFAKHLDRAHLRSGGLLVDLGTKARHKHTLGDWKSGWRGDFSDEKVTFSYISGNAAHVFFDAHPAEVGGGKITVRGRGVGSQKGRVYLNGEYKGSFELTKDAFSHAVVEFQQGLEAGQNQLMIRCNRRTKAADGGQAAMAIDYIRIVPESARRGPASAAYDSVNFPDSSGGLDGVVLSAGESLTFNLPVPVGARLRGGARTRNPGEKGRLEIVALGDDGKEQLLIDREVGDRTTGIDSSLEGFAEKTVALTLRVSAGEVVLNGAGLDVPRADGKRAPGELRAKNLVLVLIDTLRADKLGLYNPRTRVRTDYLDRLGRGSMVFERALAPENWTKPSIASLLSGLYPDSHRTQDDRDKLPRSVVTAAKHLRALGFTTAGFVANGYVSAKFGFRQGWDVWTNYVREGKANRAQYVVDDAAAWLEKRPEDKPFFLYVHTIDPHVPYIPPRKYWSLYDTGPYKGPVQPTKTAKLLEGVKTGRVKLTDRDKIRLEALYDGEITYHDDHLARLHEALDKQGLLDDTLIVVTSDHGEEFFEHGKVGHGHSLYEELLHVPLVFSLPGAEQEGVVRSSCEVNLVDVMPTGYDILGVEWPQDTEGRSLVPLLEGKARVDFPSVSFSVFLSGQRAARMGRYKVIYRGRRSSLYDLDTDPRETHDVSAGSPVALASIRDALGNHLGRFVRSGISRDKVKRARHKKEKTTIDPETERQLKALGYLGGE